MEITNTNTYKNLPFNLLLKRAQEAIDYYVNRGLEPYEHFILRFKFTCEHCGERCIFEKPFTLFEKGECESCKGVSLVTEGGFMMEFYNEYKRGFKRR